MAKPLKDQIKLKRIWKQVVFFALVMLLIVAVPIIINECYKPNKGYITVWGGAEVLSYYGTLLGATATILVLDRTIKFTRKQIQHDRYIQTEQSKWEQIECAATDLLDFIMPAKLNEMYIRILAAQPQKYLSPDFVIFAAQVRIMRNKFLHSIPAEDKREMDEFLKKLKAVCDKVSEIANEYQDILEKANKIISERNEKVAEIQMKPHSENATVLIRKTYALQDNEYTELIETQMDCFSRIYAMIEEKAAKLL